MLYNDLALFTSVAKNLSYSEAARELEVTPSLVSRRLAMLEERLGFRLLERTTRQVRLTTEGQRLLDLCEAPVESLTEALTSSTVGPQLAKGRIRITAPLLAAKRDIWPALSAFIQQHPDISIELLPADDYLDFMRDGIDLAFRFGPLPASGLIARPLWKVDYALCASPDLLQRFGLTERCDIDTLQQLPAITTNLPWRFEEQSPFQPANISHHMADLELLLQGIRQGMGVGFLPVPMIEADMQTLVVDGLIPKTRTLYLVYPTRRLLPQRVRLLVDWFTRSVTNE